MNSQWFVNCTFKKSNRVLTQLTKKVSSSCSYNLQRISQINNRYFDCPTEAIILIFYVAGSLVPNTIFLVLHFLYCTQRMPKRIHLTWYLNHLDTKMTDRMVQKQYINGVGPISYPKWGPPWNIRTLSRTSMSLGCVLTTDMLFCVYFFRSFQDNIIMWCGPIT